MRNKTEAELSFLLRLTDRLQVLSDPLTIQLVACRSLGEHLAATRVLYADVLDDEELVIDAQYTSGAAPLRSRYPSVTDAVRSTTSAPPFTRSVSVAVVKADRCVALLTVDVAEARGWRPEEVAFLETIAERTWDAVERCRAEAERASVERAVRERDEEQRFLLELSDAIRPLMDGVAIAELTAERLGRHLKVARCLYGAVDATGEWFCCDSAWTDGSAERFPPRVRILDFGNLVDIYEGRTLVIEDTITDARTTDNQHAYENIGSIRSYLAVPLMKEGKFAAAFAVHDRAPRRWTQSEIKLVEEMAERTWAATERARAETARKSSEQLARTLLAEAKKARAEAEAANRVKDEFLATLSHELRTPVAAILLWAGALRSGAVSAGDIVGAIDAIVQSAKSQSRLIEDLLDLSKLTSGGLVLMRSHVCVKTLAEAAIDMLKPMAVAKKVRLTLEVESGLGDAFVDSSRLKQILWNLLENAIKFTPERGSVALRVGNCDDHLVLDVADTGAGISAEFLPHVFERFRQADMGETRQHMGLGIGLALAQQLARLHGGTISVESDGPGRGATFRVRLPCGELGVDRPEVDRKGEPVRLNGLRVLLIEDDARTREVMGWTLEHAGAKVVSVGEAAEALAILEQENAVQVIVSDLELPNTSGYDLIKRVAADYRHRGLPMPPSCAVSAHARDVDRQRAIDAGFDMYLAKPITPDQLVEAVTALWDVLSSAHGVSALA